MLNREEVKKTYESIKEDVKEFMHTTDELHAIHKHRHAIEGRVNRKIALIMYGQEIVDKAEALVGQTVLTPDCSGIFRITSINWNKYEMTFIGNGSALPKPDHSDFICYWGSFSIHYGKQFVSELNKVTVLENPSIESIIILINKGRESEIARAVAEINDKYDRRIKDVDSNINPAAHETNLEECKDDEDDTLKYIADMPFSTLERYCNFDKRK